MKKQIINEILLFKHSTSLQGLVMVPTCILFLSKGNSGKSQKTASCDCFAGEKLSNLRNLPIKSLNPPTRCHTQCQGVPRALDPRLLARTDRRGRGCPQGRERRSRPNSSSSVPLSTSGPEDRHLRVTGLRDLPNLRRGACSRARPHRARAWALGRARKWCP